jgi:hypothetical protein
MSFKRSMFRRWRCRVVLLEVFPDAALRLRPGGPADARDRPVVSAGQVAGGLQRRFERTRRRSSLPLSHTEHQILGFISLSRDKVFSAPPAAAMVRRPSSARLTSSSSAWAEQTA